MPSADEETVAHVGERIQELEKEKRAATAMLSFLDDDAEEREKIEVELQRFEAWAASVQPFLTDPTYLSTASYTELRLAVRILGIRVTVYPTSGDWPYRYQIEATVPEVIASIARQSLD